MQDARIDDDQTEIIYRHEYINIAQELFVCRFKNNFEGIPVGSIFSIADLGISVRHTLTVFLF